MIVSIRANKLCMYMFLRLHFKNLIIYTAWKIKTHNSEGQSQEASLFILLPELYYLPISLSPHPLHFFHQTHQSLICACIQNYCLFPVLKPSRQTMMKLCSYIMNAWFIQAVIGIKLLIFIESMLQTNACIQIYLQSHCMHV